jgi:hypothetical protein
MLVNRRSDLKKLHFSEQQKPHPSYRSEKVAFLGELRALMTSSILAYRRELDIEVSQKVFFVS